MRIWGYIFIVLNIGAATAFTYFATKVWKARTEWQLALVRQQLAIDGLPLEAPPDPRDLNGDSVPFRLLVGKTEIDQIKKDTLKGAIPNGGPVLGTTDLVTNLQQEIERVDNLVFAAFAFDKKISLPKLNAKGEEEKDGAGKVIMEEYQFLSPEKRQRLAVTLISLARGKLREGTYALYRDLRTNELIEVMDQPPSFQAVPDLGRYESARRDLKYLGRTNPQVSVLELLEAIGRVNEAITLSLPPSEIKLRGYAARVAVARWLRAEMPYAAPAPFRSPNAPPGDAPAPKNEALDLLESKLKPLIDPEEDNADSVIFELPKVIKESLIEFNRTAKDAKDKKPVEETKVLKNFPKGYLLKYIPENDPKQIRPKIDTAVKDLRDQVGADTGLKNPEAAALVPFLADLAANPLETREQIEAAKNRLLELLALRSTTGSEKEAYVAIADILFAPKPFKEEKDQAKARREVNIDTAGLKMLKAYFEEAEAKSSANGEFPADAAAARAKIAALKPIRDPGQKRRDIAHLLYHLDGYLALDYVNPAEKTIDGNKVQAYDGDISARVRWFKLMFSALAPNNPQDESLSAEEKAAAAKQLDQIHKERAEWHRRVAAVVGLETYVKSIEAQAGELANTTHKLHGIIAQDQSYFEKEREEYIFYLTQLNARIENSLVRDRDAAALKDKWTVDRDARNGERDALRADLKDKQGKAKTTLVDLDKKVQELFLVTRKLGEAQDALLGLELQLREIELTRSNKR
jgi:hypothetical protein